MLESIIWDHPKTTRTSSSNQASKANKFTNTAIPKLSLLAETRISCITLPQAKTIFWKNAMWKLQKFIAAKINGL